MNYGKRIKVICLAIIVGFLGISIIGCKPGRPKFAMPKIKLLTGENLHSVVAFTPQEVMVFGIKKEDKQVLKSEVPVQAVISMKERKLTNEQIIEQLKSQGYSLQAIRDALTQAEVKQSAVNPELPPLPGIEEPAPVEGTR